MDRQDEIRGLIKALQANPPANPGNSQKMASANLIPPATYEVMLEALKKQLCAGLIPTEAFKQEYPSTSEAMQILKNPWINGTNHELPEINQDLLALMDAA